MYIRAVGHFYSIEGGSFRERLSKAKELAAVYDTTIVFPVDNLLVHVDVTSDLTAIHLQVLERKSYTEHIITIGP